MGENSRQKNLKTKQIQLVETLWLFNGSVNSKNHMKSNEIQFGNEIRFLFLNAIWDLTTWLSRLEVNSTKPPLNHHSGPTFIMIKLMHISIHINIHVVNRYLKSYKYSREKTSKLSLWSFSQQIAQLTGLDKTRLRLQHFSWSEFHKSSQCTS